MRIDFTRDEQIVITPHSRVIKVIAFYTIHRYCQDHETVEKYYDY